MNAIDSIKRMLRAIDASREAGHLKEPQVSEAYEELVAVMGGLSMLRAGAVGSASAADLAEQVYVLLDVDD